MSYRFLDIVFNLMLFAVYGCFLFEAGKSYEAMKQAERELEELKGKKR